MFDNLNLRNKFLALAAVPVNVLVILALWSAGAGHYGRAAVAGAGALLTMGLAWNLAGTVARRLAALTATADELAASRLPALLGQLDQPQRSSAPVAAPPAGGPGDGTPTATGHDELARLALALERIETETRTLVDREREAITRHLGAMVKNLARRNQSLLDRQIEHIDWLEAKEQDPERLEQLFKLDHLATRMRRTSESVLVLGGAESTRQRGGPAPIADVLRVAMGETEDYRNIRLRTVDPAFIAGGPAFDLAHLLAEVVENATQFSPPESPVELHATALEDGRLRVTVIDRGVGMDQRQLDRANAIVADPPGISLSVGHAVGFIVIGRLARRIGASVELSATAGSGVTVQIDVPAPVVILDHHLAPASDAAGAGRREVAAAVPPARDEAPAAPVVPPAPVGPRSQLSGLRHAELPESEGWTPPAVERSRRARPLRARDGATAAVPESLRPAHDRPARISPDRDSAPAALDAAAAGVPAAVDAGKTVAKPAAAGNRVEPELPRVAAVPLPVGDEAGPLTTEALMADALAAEALAAEELAAEALAAEALAAEAGTADASPAGSGGSDPSRRPSWMPGPPPRQPAVPSGRSARDREAGTLAEALPSGAAFDSGVERLLAPAPDRSPSGAVPAAADRTVGGGEDGPWTPPTAGPAAGGPSLSRRQRGAGAAAPSSGPGARASARKPEDIRSMLTRYRDGLKSTGTGPTPTGSIVPAGPEPAGDPVPADPAHAASGPPVREAGTASDPERPNARSRRRNRPQTAPTPEDI